MQTSTRNGTTMNTSAVKQYVCPHLHVTHQGHSSSCEGAVVYKGGIRLIPVQDVGIRCGDEEIPIDRLMGRIFQDWVCSTIMCIQSPA